MEILTSSVSVSQSFVLRIQKSQSENDLMYCRSIHPPDGRGVARAVYLLVSQSPDVFEGAAG